MKLLETHFIKNEHGVYLKLHKCEFGNRGKWLLETTGAYGKVDTKIVEISANKAAQMIESE